MNKNSEALRNYAEAMNNPAKAFGSAEEMFKLMGSINQIVYGRNSYKAKNEVVTPEADEEGLVDEYFEELSPAEEELEIKRENGTLCLRKDCKEKPAHKLKEDKRMLCEEHYQNVYQR